MSNKISAVIITYNEERNIERCISSLKGIADEVLVVDSFSNDKTVELAQKLGARVVQHKFEGYIQQKNAAISYANFEWILSLDADEAISEELKIVITREKIALTSDVYSFNRLTNYCGKWIKHCGWYPDVKVRLFQKSVGQWGGKNPHDKFILNEGSVCKHLKGDLLHYTFYSVDEHTQQIDRFSKIAAQSYYEKGIRSSIIKLILNPFSKFIRNYIFKLGFLDGYYGWLICSKSAYATYLKYARLKKIQEGKEL